MIDVVFLMIIATFCTPSDWDNCGFLISMPTEMLDIVRSDYDKIYGWTPIEEGYYLKGFHFENDPYSLIYVAEEYSDEISDYGCLTIWHEIAHADMNYDEEFEHSEMIRKYKCGKTQLDFIG